MTARPIFIGGTASHVGKSWVATALCRYLYRMGHRVAPFKAQNMSNNSMVCPGGGEIGRAQVAQAEASGLAPHLDMNPILLKPTSDMGSQVVLHGRPWKNLKAAEYYAEFEYLIGEVLESYHRLAANYDFVVIEGAGSITELNLKHHDLVNLGFASRVGARCILVADVDRGGVFASIIGTFHLLEASEAAMIPAFLINRFRGDPELFKEGVGILEKHTNRSCLGVFPFAKDIYLDPEDGVCLETREVPDVSSKALTSAAIVRLPHISNFTDFRLLPDAVYLSQPLDKQFDVVFLPGTKNTIDDMLWLRLSGMADWILDQASHGARIVGVCGGFQILGEEIMDPDGVESSTGSVRGLGLLPVKTVLASVKITETVQGRTPSGISFSAYEIHMGVTTASRSLPPFALLENGRMDGVRLDRVVGTYLHGAFENVTVLEELLSCSLGKQAVRGDKESHYDRLADWFATNVNQEMLFREYLG